MTYHGDDDPLAARLRAALTSEADMVQPSDDGLQNVRAGIGASRSWWRHPASPALAAALVLGLMAGGIAVLAGGGDDDVTVGPPATSSSGTPSKDANESPSPSPSETASTGTPTAAAIEGDVYVYYVADTADDGPRLYRETQPGIGGDPATQALTAALAQQPADPDYASSIWPKGTELTSYSVDGDTATVDLSKFAATGGAVENVAVQQLVYTVTANDKDVKKVRLLVDGRTPPSGHFDWSQPISRAPMLDVQGLVWLLTPTQGATVSSPVHITGYGTAFEATISWEVYRGDQKVAEGNTMGGANGEFGEFSDTVDLEPGTYELRALEFSAKDGSPQHVDTKTFTVVPSPT